MKTTELIDQIESPAWRELLQRFLSADTAERRRAKTYLSNMQSERPRIDFKESALYASTKDSLRLLEVAVGGEFPGGGDPRDGSGIEVTLCNWFIGLHHPALVGAIESLYPKKLDFPFVLGSLLATLSVQKSPEAVEAIRRIVRQHGLPLKTFPRFFREISSDTALTGSLAPDLLQHAGNELENVTDFLNLCVANKDLDAAKLVPVLPIIEKETAELLKKAKRMQQPEGKKWRWVGKYANVRYRLGAYLDMLGLIPGAAILLLRDAQSLHDPRLLLFATMSLLRRGENSPDDFFVAIASSHETRSALFELLDGLGQLERFPLQYRTLEAFAASDMVKWLCHPSELGLEPEILELEAKITGTGEAGKTTYCLWRFSVRKKECAGISGPYAADAGERPVWGAEGFSKFTEWDSATPEQHLQSVRETLKAWSVEWCKRRVVDAKATSSQEIRAATGRSR